jgi:membrane protein DedA with SNARE-associated domain
MSLELISLETIEEFARTYGYGAVLVGILLENLGLPLPGESIVVVGGFLAGRGDLNYWGVLACSVSGAIAGNTIGYWIGVLGGWPLIERVSRLFRINEEKLLDIKHRFSINAARAVFLGRFITLLRVFAGPLAGIVEMPFGSFMFYNVLGAVIWAGVIVTAACFAGHVLALEQLMQWATKFSFVALGAIAAWFAVPYGVKVLRKQWMKPLEKSETI